MGNDDSEATLQLKIICEKNYNGQRLEIYIDPPISSFDDVTVAQSIASIIATDLKNYLEHAKNLSRSINVK